MKDYDALIKSSAQRYNIDPDVFRRLLIRESALIEQFIEVRRDQWLPFLRPLVVVGASQLDARLPVSRDWTESSRFRTAVPRRNLCAGILHVRRSLSG